MANGKVDATSLNLRDGPDANANSSAILVKDAAVDVITTSGDGLWLLVSALVDGHTRIGWVQAQFVTKDVGPAGPTIPDVLHGSDPAFEFLAPVVSGNDIVVSGVLATWFGGSNDPTDDGQTKSGISTIANPQILGCALPMDGWNVAATDGSPIPKLPWKTQVRVHNKVTGLSVTVSLIDIGPSKKASPPRGIDLTSAAFRALGVELSVGRMTVDYTIVGGARYLRPGHGQTHEIKKPPVKEFIRSPNVSSRNGEAISMIVMHYTEGSSAQGAIDRFSDPAQKVSAHYIIERNGDIYQMVEDGDEAWHARAANSYSIGIEHVAVPNQQMAVQQEMSSVALIRWLMATYNVERERVVGHRFAVGEDTNCPDHLFGAPTKQAVIDWVNRHFPAGESALSA